MKKYFLVFICILTSIFFLTACGNSNGNNSKAEESSAKEEVVDYKYTMNINGREIKFSGIEAEIGLDNWWTKSKYIDDKRVLKIIDYLEKNTGEFKEPGELWKSDWGSKGDVSITFMQDNKQLGYISLTNEEVSHGQKYRGRFEYNDEVSAIFFEKNITKDLIKILERE